MKYNSCLLDRLYCTKCNYYIQIHLLCGLLRCYMHRNKEGREGEMRHLQKKSCTYFCMKIEDIKAGCAPVV